jgi:predicted DNA-binding ArsR family transcriptional regulator
MNLEERVSELEKLINLLLQKDKEIDRFCEEILNAVKENSNTIVNITQAQIGIGEVLEGLVSEIKKMQSE